MTAFWGGEKKIKQSEVFFFFKWLPTWHRPKPPTIVAISGDIENEQWKKKKGLHLERFLITETTRYDIIEYFGIVKEENAIKTCSTSLGGASLFIFLAPKLLRKKCPV